MQNGGHIHPHTKWKWKFFSVNGEKISFRKRREEVLLEKIKIFLFNRRRPYSILVSRIVLLEKLHHSKLLLLFYVALHLKTP